jgi:hypothetical protein
MSRSQQKRILWALQAAFPDWVPAPALSRISLQYSARIYTLRKAGWQIANRVEVGSDGVKRGYFRLATPGTLPNPTSKTGPPPIADNSLFGTITPVQRHRDDG